MACVRESIGWIVGESTPLKSLVIFDKSNNAPVKAGDYVVAEGPEGCVLGIVETVWSGHRMLPPSVTDPEAVYHIAEWTVQAGGEDIYNRGSIRWLALLDPLLTKKKVVTPKTPVMPGSTISRADPSQLARIFSPESRGWIRLGHLAGDDTVAFHVDANGLTRHLAILAVTGGGKSNTVCVLTKRLVGQLCGTMVIFDMHGEYSNMRLPGVRIKVHKPPKLHPTKITTDELFTLTKMTEAAVRQRRYLRWAWHTAIASYYKILAKTTKQYDDIVGLAKNLMEALSDKGKLKNIHNMIASGKPENSEMLKKNITMWLRQFLPVSLSEIVAEAIVENEYYPPRQVVMDSLEGAIAKLEDLEAYYSEILDVTAYTNLMDAIPPCTLTVFDLSELDEDAADAIVSHYLRRLLIERKLAKVGAGGYRYPAIVVIEEAHVLVPKDGGRLTKYWAARVAREGRKFGLGLVLVSQRPKNVDPNVLSQTNNKIILRMVEPEDIRYVQRASEEMSDDIASLLPTLNPGEAVILGKMAKLPALVKIDECPPEEKPSGGDIDIVKIWLSHKEEEDEERRILEAL